MADTDITINFTEPQAAFIRRLVAERGYGSADEVVGRALELLRENDNAMDKRLREEAAPVYERIKSGQERVTPLEEAFDELWEHHERSKKAHRPFAVAK